MPQDLVITPNRGSTTSGAQIAFTGYSGASSIYLKVLPDSSLSFEGSAGQLFSITDNLSSGTIFSVNDITGIPSFDVNASGLIRIAPYAGFTTVGGTYASGKLHVSTGAAATKGIIVQGYASQSANLQEWQNSAGTALGYLDYAGNFTVAGNVTANSDEKIKKNVETISGALQKVMDMRGVYFNRVDTNIKNVGVIAQEVEPIVPELVRESDGLKSVAYGNITAVLIEAIKEQNKKIEELEKKICQLTFSQS